MRHVGGDGVRDLEDDELWRIVEAHVPASEFPDATPAQLKLLRQRVLRRALEEELAERARLRRVN